MVTCMVPLILLNISCIQASITLIGSPLQKCLLLPSFDFLLDLFFFFLDEAYHLDSQVGSENKTSGTRMTFKDAVRRLHCQCC